MKKISGNPFNIRPLPPGLPHTAYILLWYPLFTQPFIFREVEGLRKRLPLAVHSLYGRNLRHCSTEMLAAADGVQTLGVRSVPRLVLAFLQLVLRRPRLVWSLFRRSVFHPWRSWEIFGENLWAFFCGIYLGRLFQDSGIDLIYAPWPRGAATAAWVAASVSGLPFATSARGDNLEPADPDLTDKLNAALFIRANNAADRKRINALIQGEEKQKTALVYNSLTVPAPDKSERKRKQPILSGNNMQLLAVGRFDVTKGFDILLQACAILRNRGIRFQLTLAGGGGKMMGLGQLTNDLALLRENLNLESCVSMPGLISHNDLPGLLLEHDIFVAPCVIHSSGRRDGIPNTVVEAMAYGLPVVSTTVNALPEVVRHGETGLAVAPGDATALAEAIIWLGAHPGEARKMGSAGAALAGRMFDPALNSRRLAELFASRYSEWKNSCAV